MTTYQELAGRIASATQADRLHSVAADAAGAELTTDEQAALQRMFEEKCVAMWPRQCGRRG